MVPPSLYSISSLIVVNLQDNLLKGTLPSDLGFTLPNLQVFNVANNNFTGPLPQSIANTSNLNFLQVTDNSITGPIPNNLGSLPNLKTLGLGGNPLGDNMLPGDLSFFNSLVNCTHLKYLVLEESGLKGQFPSSIVNLSTTMEKLYLYINHIYGSIHHDIGKLKNMQVLSLYDNLLTGTIPESIGELSKLRILSLRDNNISGAIPTSISNITQLVPGAIPDNIVFLSHCVHLNLSQNLINGSLPSNIGSLKQLAELDVSYNKLIEDIPTTMGGCVMLEMLYMQENLFQGKIPSSFRDLKSLQIFDISRNNISGNIPRFFSEFRLIEFLNLSYNKLGGEVPTKGLFLNFSAVSVIENSELCGGIPALHLSACPVKVSRNKKKAFALRLLLILVLVPLGIFLVCLALFCHRRRNSKKLKDTVPVFKDNQHPQLSYQDLLLATNEFSPNNLLGEGRFGSVYKGVLESVEHIVVVKVLKVEIHGTNKTFLAECETLKNLRHRNLIKIITACSSIDYKGNDFKALVFEFMANGSVDNWLHPSPSYQGNERSLTLVQRLNISIDVALGVDYLHHHSHESIIHCDIKPSNILLDENFVAHIGDFGLARFSFATSDVNQAQESSTGVPGTIGYVPPEYGMCAEKSTEGDVYSYGIFLLEMFSRKRPTESSILVDTDNNLHNHVRKALPERVMDIVDPQIVQDEEERGLIENQSFSRAAMEVCLTSIFEVGVLCSVEMPRKRIDISIEVGVLCSVEMPRKRIDISIAIKQLHVARDKLLQCRQ